MSLGEAPWHSHVTGTAQMRECEWMYTGYAPKQKSLHKPFSGVIKYAAAYVHDDSCGHKLILRRQWTDALLSELTAFIRGWWISRRLIFPNCRTVFAAGNKWQIQHVALILSLFIQCWELSSAKNTLVVGNTSIPGRFIQFQPGPVNDGRIKPRSVRWVKPLFHVWGRRQR